ncbi:hypothetical protein HK104_006456 [Borealophlyctis nickersoniae]|nr:hypothetical protein HK104_006456 [Borealophlyctis nickersoniae]
MSQEDRARLLRERVFHTSTEAASENVSKEPDASDLHTPRNREKPDLEGLLPGSGIAVKRSFERRSPEYGRATPVPETPIQHDPPLPPKMKSDESLRAYSKTDLRAAMAERAAAEEETRRVYREQLAERAALEGEARRVHEEHVRDLEHHVRGVESENQELRSRLDILHKQHETALRDNATLVERATKAAQLADAAAAGNVPAEHLKEANERVDILIRENDALVEQNRSSRKENEKLREEVSRQAKELHTTLQSFEGTREELARTMNDLETLKEQKSQLEKESKMWQDELEASTAENESLHADLKRCTGEVRVCQGKIADLKRSLEEVTSRYQVHVRESSALAARERELMESLKTSETEINDLRTKTESLTSENKILRKEYDELLDVSHGLEKRISQMEEKEVDSFKQIQQQVDKAEEAALDRDKAIVAEQQAQREIQRLGDRVKDLQAKFREKVEAEVAILRAQFTTEKRKFAEEMAAMEATHATLQSQADRAIRDKRSAESELEKLTRHLPTDHERLTMTLEELNSKLRASERERHEAVHKLESLHQRLTREQNRFEKEKQQIAERSEDAYRRLRRVERDLEETKEDRVKMLGKLADLEHAHKALQEAKHKAQAQHDAEFAAATQKYENQIAELTSKLEHVGEAHSRTCRELQQLLSEQRQMGERWKEESAHLTSRHTHAVTDLREQLSRSAQRIEELESQILRAEARRKEVLMQLMEEKRDAARVEARCRDAESVMEGLKRQVSAAAVREREVGEEKKQLQRELDRVNLEKERLEREYAFHVKQGAGKASAKLRASMGRLNDKDEDSFSEKKRTSDEIRILKAEIDRVKQRSRARDYPMLQGMELSDDDDVDVEPEFDESV